MLPALKIVVAVGICAMTFNHSMLSDASAVHSFTTACMKFCLEYLLNERHNCHMIITQPKLMRQLKVNGLYYYSLVYHSHIMMEQNKMPNS